MAAMNLSQAIILEIVGMAIVAAAAFIAVLGHMEANKFRQVIAREYSKTDNKPNGGDDAEVVQVTDLTVKPDTAGG